VAAAGGAAASVKVTTDPEQLAALTVTAALFVFAVKSEALAVLHASGSLNVAVTDVLAAVAAIEEKLGATVSTLSVRVTTPVARFATSKARNPKLCGPSRSAGGVKVQVAEMVPQPVQLTPAVEKAPPSTLASTRETGTPDDALPEYAGVLSLVTLPFGGPERRSEGVMSSGFGRGSGCGTGTTIASRRVAGRQLFRSRLSRILLVSSAQASST
jgi:hypothetical protein